MLIANRELPVGARGALRRAAWLAVVLAAGLVCGCASYTTRLGDLRAKVARGELEAALARVTGETNPGEVLHHLERGLLLRLGRDYPASNEELGAAEICIEDFYTISLSERVLTFLVDDEQEAYRGEIFEANYLHFYRMLNFFAMGERASAVVEARRLALRLTRVRDEESDPYQGDDPFLHYVTWVILESAGEWNAALIAYRRAGEVWGDAARSGGGPPPAWLSRDLQRAADRAGITLDALVFDEMGLSTPPRAAADGERGGSLLLLFESGWVPHKVSEHVRVPIFSNDSQGRDHEGALALGRTLGDRYRFHRRHGSWAPAPVEIDYFIDAAIPLLVEESTAEVVACTWRLAPTEPGLLPRGVPPPEGTTMVLDDLAQRTRKAFEAQWPGRLARTFARALLKYVATRQAERGIGSWAGVLANLTGVATEKADTRSWLLLPAEIQVSRIELSAGDYRLTMDARDREGRSLEQRALTVSVALGGVTVVSWRALE